MTLAGTSLQPAHGITDISTRASLLVEECIAVNEADERFEDEAGLTKSG
jgi:hypothetical protein